MDQSCPVAGVSQLVQLVELRDRGQQAVQLRVQGVLDPVQVGISDVAADKVVDGLLDARDHPLQPRVIEGRQGHRCGYRASRRRGERV